MSVQVLFVYNLSNPDTQQEVCRCTW